MTSGVAAFALNWVDICLLLVMLVSLMVGFWRGLTFEVLSLLGWIVAYLAAPHVAPWVGTWLPLGADGTQTHHVASMVVAFLLVLLAWALSARLVRALIRATPLSGFDRFLGAGFGVLRGTLICVLAVLLVGYTPMAKSSAWRESLAVPWLQALVKGLAPSLVSTVNDLSIGEVKQCAA